MINALIIDDEPLARSIVAEYLQSHPQVQVVAECSDGFEGVKAIQQHRPDLVFLDIQMPKINGFEMLELIENPPPVIFTTAFDAFALRAFDAHAVDYLLKPFTRERFDQALQRWQEQQPQSQQVANAEALLQTVAQSPAQQDRVVVKTGHKILIIPVADIHFLEAASDYVSIHTEKGTYLKKRTMYYFERVLDERQFVRVHRSYIVQVQQINRLEPYQKDTFLAQLRSGKQIPVSRTGYNKLKSILHL